MKKFVAILFAVLVLLSVAACQNGAEGGKDEPVTAPLSEVMAEIIEGNLPEELMVMDMPVEKEMYFMFYGMEEIEGIEEAYASEPMISSIAHTVSLIRVTEGTDAEALASEIEGTVDPRRWICVEAEKTVVKARGNLILVVMSTEEAADKISASFDAYFEK